MKISHCFFCVGRGFTLSSALVLASYLHAADLATYVLPDKTMTYCSEGSPSGFDVAQYGSSTDYTASAGTVYNRLVEFKRGPMEIEPSLATHWDVSKDGRVYTFYLRRGVNFHTTPWFTPTRKFNAKDVLFTFERMRNPDMPFRKAYPSQFPDWEFFGFDKLQKIEALDPYTVRFTLKAAHAPFLSNLAAPIASIVSEEYAQYLLKAGRPSEINLKPIGTGPFIFKEYIRDAAIHFKGNSNYWKPEDVQLAQLTFVITPDAQVRLQKLKKNECQIIGFPPLDSIEALQKNPDLKLIRTQGFSLSFLAYNVTHKPLNDVRVRRALDRVIDKKALIKAVFQGQAQAAVAPLPPPQWAYDKTLHDAPQDLNAARKLLAEAGYPKGFTLTLWASPVQRSYNSNARLTAELIQADWQKIGVTAKIVSYEWGEFLRRAFQGEHDAVLMGGSGITDPDHWLSGFLGCQSMHGGNFSQWCYKPFDDLLQQARRTMDPNQRTALYLKAQKIFKHEQPYTAIAYPISYYVLRKEVVGFEPYLFGETVFYRVRLK